MKKSPGKIKYLSLPTKFELQPLETDDRVRRLKINVMHELENDNFSYFDMSAIENAKDSIKNVPVLAFVKTRDGADEKDFAGHEIELRINDDGIDFYYLGRPIGVVPELNNNYHYEVIDDKNHVIVDAILWNDYANEAIEILENKGKSGHSMEIRVDDGFYDENKGYFVITKYRYTGLVLLGDDYVPAMKNSHAELYSVKYNDGYYQMLEELKTLIKYFTHSGGDVKDNKQIASNNHEESIEGGFKVEEEKIEQIKEEVEEEEVKEEFEQEEIKEEIVEEAKEEEVEEAKEFEQEKEEEIETDFEAEKVEYESKLNKLEADLAELQDKYTQLQSDYSALEQEKSELEQYRADKLAEERRQAEDVLFEEFAEKLTEEEVAEVKEKASEMSLEDIETALYVVLGKKNASFTKRKKNDEVKLPVDKEILGDVKPGAKSYDYLMDKYAK